MNKNVLSLDLKIDRESLIRTVSGSEFQTVGVENRKARLEKSVLVNGWSSSGMATLKIVTYLQSTPLMVTSALQTTISDVVSDW